MKLHRNGKERKDEHQQNGMEGAMKTRWSCFLIPGLGAAVLAVGAKVAFNFGQNQWYGVGIVGASLLFPGILFAGVWAMVFSPQGVHGLSDYEWIIAPASWIAYFAVGVVICRSRAHR